MNRVKYLGRASGGINVRFAAVTLSFVIASCSNSASHSVEAPKEVAPASESVKPEASRDADYKTSLPTMFIARVPVKELRKTSTESVEFVGLSGETKSLKSTNMPNLFLTGEPMKLVNENGALVAAGEQFKLQLGIVDKKHDKSLSAKDPAIRPISISSNEFQDKVDATSLLRGNLFNLLFRVLGAQAAGTTNSVGNIFNFLSPYRSIGQLFTRYVSADSLVAQGYRYFPFTPTDAWGSNITNP